MTCFLTWGIYRKPSTQDREARLFLGDFEPRVCWRKDCTSPLLRSEATTRQCLHLVSVCRPKVRQWASCHQSSSLRVKICTWGDSWWAGNSTFGSTASHLDTQVPSEAVWLAFFHSTSCIADQLQTEGALVGGIHWREWFHRYSWSTTNTVHFGTGLYSWRLYSTQPRSSQRWCHKWSSLVLR